MKTLAGDSDVFEDETDCGAAIDHAARLLSGDLEREIRAANAKIGELERKLAKAPGAPEPVNHRNRAASAIDAVAKRHYESLRLLADIMKGGR